MDMVNGDKQFRNYNLSAIRAAKEIIDEMPFKYDTIEELAEKVGIRPDILKPGFKKLYGKSIGRYWKNVKLEAARDMLEQNGISVAEVAAKCRYTHNSFSRWFKNETNMTPMQWQNREK